MKKSTVVLLHLIYWIYKFFGTIYIYASALTTSQIQNIFNSNNLPPLIGPITEFICFYIFYFYLFPLFLARKRIILFIISGIITWLILSLFLSYYYYDLMRSPSTRIMVFTLMSYSFNILISGIIGSLFRGFITWYSEIRLKEQLIQKNLQSELALLKAQVNPHFLFNTINNIDVLIEKDSKAASMYLKQLSDIMRFMLNDTPLELILLTKELEYIRKYIELQKIRTANEKYVNLTVIGSNEKLTIAPAIFIPFIENAFKHSTNKKIENAINISIEITENDLSFTCANFFDNSKTFTQENSGLGIDLIKQRLQLLYRDKHSLNITKTDNQFVIKLMINTR